MKSRDNQQKEYWLGLSFSLEYLEHLSSSIFEIRKTYIVPPSFNSISILDGGIRMVARNHSKRGFNVMTGKFHKRANRLEDFFRSNEDFFKLMGDYEGLPLNLK